MKYFLLLLVLLSSYGFAQFSQQDSALIFENFLRKKDSPIIREYILSNSSEKRVAGLLAAANTGSQSYYSSIMQLPIGFNPEFQAFALGNGGPSKTASEHLLLMVKKLSPLRIYAPERFVELYVALGTVSDSSIVDSIENYINVINPIGLSYLYLKLRSRGITHSKIPELINRELSSENYNRVIPALVYLSRVPGATATANIVESLIAKELKSDTPNQQLLQIGCSALRRASYTVEDSEFYKSLIAKGNFATVVSATRLLGIREVNSNDDLAVWISLINYANINVGVEAAQTLISTPVKPEFRSRVITELKSINKFHPALAQPLFTFITWGSSLDEKRELFKQYQPNMSSIGVLNSIITYPELSDSVIPFLHQRFVTGSPAERLITLSGLEALMKKSSYENEALSHFVDLLELDFPPTASMLVDATKDSLFPKYRETLNEAFHRYLEQFGNNANHSESIVAVVKQLQTDSSFNLNHFKSIICENPIPSVRELVGLGGDFEKQRFELFSRLWANAFVADTAVIKLERGEIVLELNNEFAPLSSANFVLLAHQKYFDGVPFHRVVSGFVVQAGDKTETGWGGPGYEIVSEFSFLPYNEGVLGMASSGKDTEGSQWFITTGYYPHLERAYTVFGKVIAGMELLPLIMQEERILSLHVH